MEVEISEAQLEAYIMQNPEKVLGFKPDKIENQVHLEDYGRLDIVAFQDDVMHVLELKKGACSVGTVLQAVRYIAGLKENPAHKDKKVVIHVVGTSFDEAWFFETLKPQTEIKATLYEVTLEDGIEFGNFYLDQDKWKWIEEGEE